jgi:hypothetical protein
LRLLFLLASFISHSVPLTSPTATQHHITPHCYRTAPQAIEGPADSIEAAHGCVVDDEKEAMVSIYDHIVIFVVFIVVVACVVIFTLLSSH